MKKLSKIAYTYEEEGKLATETIYDYKNEGPLSHNFFLEKRYARLHILYHKELLMKITLTFKDIYGEVSIDFDWDQFDEIENLISWYTTGKECLITNVYMDDPYKTIYIVDNKSNLMVNMDWIKMNFNNIELYVTITCGPCVIAQDIMDIETLEKILY